jgi:hypothetical protein
LACGRNGGDPTVNIPHSAPLTAWVGQNDAGMHVVLEALLGPQDSHNARLTEESLLRERLGLSAEEQLLRLHMFGSADQIAEGGAVSIRELEFKSFGAQPESLPVRDALLWNTALRGLPLPGDSEVHLTRRTLLLHGPAEIDLSELQNAVWHGQADEINLQLRTWSEHERRKFFDWAITPPSPEPKDEES